MHNFHICSHQTSQRRSGSRMLEVPSWFSGWMGHWLFQGMFVIVIVLLWFFVVFAFVIVMIQRVNGSLAVLRYDLCFDCYCYWYCCYCHHFSCCFCNLDDTADECMASCAEFSFCDLGIMNTFKTLISLLTFYFLQGLLEILSTRMWIWMRTIFWSVF